jgi:hypothetical protein
LGTISPKEIKALWAELDEVIDSARRTAGAMIKFGTHLLDIKERGKLSGAIPYGKFETWRIETFGLQNDRWCQRCILAAKKYAISGCEDAVAFMDQIWGHKSKELTDGEQDDGSKSAASGTSDDDDDDESDDDDDNAEGGLCDNLKSAGLLTKPEGMSDAQHNANVIRFDLNRAVGIYLGQPFSENEKLWMLLELKSEIDLRVEQQIDKMGLDYGEALSLRRPKGE